MAPRRFSAVTFGGIPITHRLNLMRSSTPDLRKAAPKRKVSSPAAAPHHVIVHMPPTVEESASSSSSCGGATEGPESGLGSDISSSTTGPLANSPVSARYHFNANESLERRRHSYDHVLELRAELEVAFSSRGGTHSAAVSPHRSLPKTADIEESGVDLRIQLEDVKVQR